MTIERQTPCSICGKLIVGNDCFSMGSDGFRHKACGPGSKAWKLKYPVGNVEIRALLDKPHTPKPAPGPLTQKATQTSLKLDPIYRDCAAVLARWKYLRYMNTVRILDLGKQLWHGTGGTLFEINLTEEPPTIEVYYAKYKSTK